MQVLVSGKHVDVGEALRTRISDDLTTSIGKYFERGGDAEVVLSRDGHAFRIDCMVTLASGQQLQSHGLGGDAHGAFDQALSKIETRIRRYKRRLKSHSSAAEAKAAEVAASSVSIDRNAKLRAYRRNGVREYILWRVEDREIDWFVLRGSEYEQLPAGPDGIVRSEVFLGLWLDPEALVRGDLAQVLAVLQQGIASPEHAAFVQRLQGAPPG